MNPFCDRKTKDSIIFWLDHLKELITFRNIISLDEWNVAWEAGWRGRRMGTGDGSVHEWHGNWKLAFSRMWTWISFDVLACNWYQFGINVNSNNLFRVKVTSYTKCDVSCVASNIQHIFVFEPFTPKGAQAQVFAVGIAVAIIPNTNIKTFRKIKNTKPVKMLSFILPIIIAILKFFNFL